MAADDLTTRARAVLAKSVFAELDAYLQRWAHALLCDSDREYALPRREAQPLAEAGLVEVLTSRRSSNLWRIRCTPLGIAVHQLTEGSATDGR